VCLLYCRVPTPGGDNILKSQKICTRVLMSVHLFKRGEFLTFSALVHYHPLRRHSQKSEILPFYSKCTEAADFRDFFFVPCGELRRHAVFGVDGCRIGAL